MKEYELINAINSIEISEKTKKRILFKMIRANKERRNIMSKKKMGIILAATVAVLGITAFAASGLVTTWYSGSSAVPDYKSLPTATECLEDVGYVPILIDSFENGYTFTGANIVDNVLADENDNAVEKFKSLAFRYGKDGNRVVFSQDKYSAETKAEGVLEKNINGMNIYYHTITAKTVPEDYVPTQEENKAVENGELYFNHDGTDVIQMRNIKSVSWQNGDMHYSLMQIDGELSKDELIKMAEEAVSMQ